MLLPTLPDLSALWPFHPPQQVTSTYRQPTWYFSVRRDRFTGRLECRLYQGDRKRPTVAYARASLSFRFNPRLSTLRADYRVDNGPVAAWSTLYPTLIDTGVTLPGGSLANPTAGQVILPMSVLAGAHAVTIRAAPKTRPKVFYIDGLADVLATARTRGCASGLFVR